VLEPIEPVAPSNVTVRGRGSGTAFATKRFSFIARTIKRLP
jgi:hypothetical protein